MNLIGKSSKLKTIDSFFKRNEYGNSKNNKLLDSNVETSTSNENFFKSPRVESKEHSLGFSKVEHEKVHFRNLQHLFLINFMLLN